MVMLGLSHENLMRLELGSPILLDIDQCAALGLGQKELLIFAGKDEIAMTEKLERYRFLPKGSTDEARKALGRKKND